MDGQDLFFYKVWQLVVGGMVGLVLITSSCMVYQDRIIERMVRSGADPIAASCAVSSKSDSICAVTNVKHGVYGHYGKE